MEHYETYEKSVTHKKLIKVTCDRCGAEIPRPGEYKVKEFTLEFREGARYPDNGWTEEWEVPDLCDECVLWLKNLLIENGVNIEKTMADW